MHAFIRLWRSFAQNGERRDERCGMKQYYRRRFRYFAEVIFYVDRPFLQVQKGDYGIALMEIQSGRKETHWIWYIFPQLKDLGHSETSEYYGIRDMAEAKEYLAHPVLRRWLLETGQLLLNLPSSDAREILGSPDSLKLRSSMTLFALAELSCKVFQQVLDKYYDGCMDQKTVEMLHSKASTR